jgi:diguanylate cyclase (GGDEF)-like protein
MLPRSRLWTRTAQVGLVALPFLLAAFAVWSALATGRPDPTVKALTLVLFPAAAMLALGNERRRSEDTAANEIIRLESASTTDSLTQLGSHRGFEAELQREVRRAIRHGYSLSLALLDVDAFHALNARNGTAHGDRVLARLGGLLSGRRIEDRPFRLGPDDFALILPYTDAANAAVVLERLRGEAEHTILGATVSAGVAELPFENVEAESVRVQAEAALREARLRGGNMVVRYDEIRSSVTVLSTTKVSSVRLLISERRLHVSFQPIFDLERGAVLGFEALSRPAPDYDLSGAAEAFDIAERLGRAAELDAICRSMILARATDLPEDVLLFVNVAPQTLDHDLLGDGRLLEELRTAGIDPGRVVIEIPERALEHRAHAVEETARLREEGIKIALDNVGEGHAALETLRKLPPDFVKIDHSVVAAALHDPTADALLAAIAAFGGKIGACVVAQGIESPALLTLIQPAAGQTQINAAQGYLLGAPAEAIPSRAMLDAVQAAFDPRPSSMA